MNRKIPVFTLLIFAVVAAVVPLNAFAQSDSPAVRITQINPSTSSGPAGVHVNLQGTIITQNGSYQISLANIMVASGTADGYRVNANFTVPELLAASYPLTLRDTKSNAEAYSQFTITTGYSVTSTPLVVQEGSGVTLNVAVTGGSLGNSYEGNIAVTLPSGTIYTASVTLGTPNARGTVSTQVTFPSSAFSPGGGSTDYVGTYRVAFGGNLASTQFNVRFTDASSYHRGDTMKIHATGYQPNQAATITITNGEVTVDTKSVTASVSGVIGTTWVVSANAPIGESTIKITPQGTAKTPVDQQTFTVMGYLVHIQVTNLADRPIPNVVVQAIDSTTKAATNSTTNSTGGATLRLEKGAYTLTAYSNGLNIGQTDIIVIGDGAFTLRCQLTDLTITVLTVDGIPIPFVNLAIKYNYQSGTISRSGSAYGQTGPSGSFTLASALAGATYTIDASLYGQIFNAQNNTATSATNKANAQVTIICPSRNVTLAVTGNNYEAIPNARVELVEISSGLFYSASADNNGVAAMEPTFGMYRVRVYKDTALIHQVNLQVFNDSQKQVRCTLYGIPLSVAVVDFFGAPIPNANVTLNGSAKAVAVTQSNGIATFEDIVGGSMQIIVQPQGIQDASQAITVNVEEPITVQVKIDKYVSVGGVLLQASTLISIIVVVIGVVLFAVVEVIRRRKAQN
ncbi:MAG: carboxypeptidase-like regulatory domain-containing protein [Candidatus Bathyarchaeota archaeon]|nr:carboxypeptidase-like regulatory domain-containing protein [Candidatus Bathyarchaeota archaeon]